MTDRQQHFWRTRLVRCITHGESCCWVQTDGTHVSRFDCTCRDGNPEVCPIDAHAVPYRLANPMFQPEEQHA